MPIKNSFKLFFRIGSMKNIDYITPEIQDKLKCVKLLILDVDGVLTNGDIIYNDDGVETKAFNVKDGLGVKLLIKAGLTVCIATGRRSRALYHRCKDFGVSDIFDGVVDKAAILDIILKKTKTSATETAFVGDDLPDLPLMRIVGLPIAVADAQLEVLKQAVVITKARGGCGAVREVCEAILQAKGLWKGILEHF